jgi:hypothetical protein
VLKIERIDGGDDARRMGAPFHGGDSTCVQGRWRRSVWARRRCARATRGWSIARCGSCPPPARC